MKKFKLILASGSPRRKELINWIGLPFEIVVSHVEENSNIADPKELVAELARQKGVAVYEKLKTESNPMVISSDTIVCLGDKVFGKPKETAEARSMLTELSGKTHTVYSAVCIHYLDKKAEFLGEAQVEFSDILPDVLEHYLASGDSLDKAGAYGIQGQALTFIKGLNGSYSNVMGFPLNKFILKLKEVCESEGFSDWRSAFE